MTKEIEIGTGRAGLDIRISSLIRHSSFDISHSFMVAGVNEAKGSLGDPGDHSSLKIFSKLAAGSDEAVIGRPITR